MRGGNREEKRAQAGHAPVVAFSTTSSQGLGTTGPRRVPGSGGPADDPRITEKRSYQNRGQATNAETQGVAKVPAQAQRTSNQDPVR